MTRTNREVYHIFLQAVCMQVNSATLQHALGALLPKKYKSLSKFAHQFSGLLSL